MRPEPEPGSEEGWRVIGAAVRSARTRLGDAVVSAYAIGSLAHGGFAPAVSDVDLALLTTEPVDRETIAAIAADVRAGGPALAARLSIFHAPWTGFADPPPGARFPPIDRYDLVRYGRLVHGPDRRAEYGIAPSPEQIRAHAVDSALERVTAERLAADLRDLRDRGVSVRDATKIVLWPVRLQHVCETGEATGNRAAAEHYGRVPEALHRALVGDALAWRELPALPDPPAALRRITAEIHDLHAEVLERVARREDLPRRAEITERARRLTADGATSAPRGERSPG